MLEKDEDASDDHQADLDEKEMDRKDRAKDEAELLEDMIDDDPSLFDEHGKPVLFPTQSGIYTFQDKDIIMSLPLTRHADRKTMIVHGEVTVKDKKGHLLEKVTYINGCREGKGYRYTPEGHLDTVYSYRKDILTGSLTTYHSNGSVNYVGAMEDGALHGEGTVWSETSEKLFTCTYDKGVLHGQAIAYHPNGQISSVSSYDKGRLINEQCSYYPTGELQTRTVYDEKGILVYPMAKFDKTGCLKT